MPVVTATPGTYEKPPLGAPSIRKLPSPVPQAGPQLFVTVAVTPDGIGLGVI
jgi:hypothetical protein